MHFGNTEQTPRRYHQLRASNTSILSFLSDNKGEIKHSLVKIVMITERTLEQDMYKVSL